MPETGRVFTRYAMSVVKIILLLIVAVVLASLFDLLVIAVIWAVFAVTAGSTTQASGMIADSFHSFWFMIVMTAVQGITWVLLAIGFVRFVDRRPFAWKELGLSFGPDAVKMFLAGVLINAVFGAVTVATMLLTGWSHIAEYGVSSCGATVVAISLALTVVLMIIVGISEETLFRGYMQTDLWRRLGPAAALILTSLAFAGLHIFFLIPGQEISPLSISGIFFASLIMGYLYIITGTIWASIGFHFFQDVLGAGVFLTGKLPYESTPVFLMSKAGDVVVAGINLGGMDNLVNIALMLALLAVLYLYHKMAGARRMK
jgi:membrane protease YdiL (CAAX protease family)